MRITSRKRIVVEDFSSDARDTIRKLADILNTFIDQVALALTSNLTIADNMKAQTFSKKLGAGESVVNFKWTPNVVPTMVSVARLIRLDGSVPTAAYSLHWVYSNGQITATLIGLADTEHYVTLIGQV